MEHSPLNVAHQLIDLAGRKISTPADRDGKKLRVSFIEKDGALDRRFQKITVNPPSADQSMDILSGLKEKYEAHHGIRITDDALVAAAKLTDR